MQTDVVKTCFRAGFYGWLLVQFAIGVPRFLWAGLAWMASYETSLYWVLMSAGWAFVIGAQFMTASVWLDRHQPPPSDTECNNSRQSMPDLTTWMLVHYMIIICLDDFHRHRRAPWWGWAIRVAYLIGVPAVLVWSTNTTIPFALAGMGFGAATGLLFMFLFLGLWLPRIDDASAVLKDAEAAVIARIHRELPPFHVLRVERRDDYSD